MQVEVQPDWERACPKDWSRLVGSAPRRPPAKTEPRGRRFGQGAAAAAESVKTRAGCGTVTHGIQQSRRALYSLARRQPDAQLVIRWARSAGAPLSPFAASRWRRGRGYCQGTRSFTRLSERYFYELRWSAPPAPCRRPIEAGPQERRRRTNAAAAAGLSKSSRLIWLWQSLLKWFFQPSAISRSIACLTTHYKGRVAHSGAASGEGSSFEKSLSSTSPFLVRRNSRSSRVNTM